MLFVMNFGLVVRSFSWRFFGPRNAPFLLPKNGKRKTLPVLAFFWSSIFVTWWFLEGFGARAPLLVLELFLVVSCKFSCSFRRKNARKSLASEKEGT